jgi:DNA-binding NarL/FixJ family response regulator
VRVLIIDDLAPFRAILRTTLQHLGHVVDEAEDGELGLARYRAARADVVLLDIYMPRKEGIETLREVLRFDPTAVVLAMSGGGSYSYSHLGILTVARHLGARGVLPKPFTYAELEQALASVAPGAGGPPATG